MKKHTLVILIVALVVIALGLFFYFNGKAETPKTQESESTVKEVDEVPDSFSLSGTVLDGVTNQPLAAKVIVRDKDRIIKDTVCNASGEYSLSLGDGTYSISAEFPGYVAKGKNDVFHSVEIEEDQGDPPNIVLWPEAQVKGRVVSDNGKGIGAEIKFIYQYDDSKAENYIFDTLSSDASGSFLLKNAYGGMQDIVITADGFALQKLTDIQLEPGKTVDLGDISMLTGVTIFGVVTDAETDKAIAGATLRYLDKSGSVLMEVKSQEDGSYKLPAVAMKDIQIVAEASGYKTIRSSFDVDNQVQYEYNLAMSKLSGISLVVDNQTGREPIKTLVTVTDIAAEKVVYEHEYDNGFYRIDDLRGGPYLVKGVSADKLTEVTAQAMAGDTTTLTLRPFAQLDVQFVLKKDGKPAKGTYRYIYKPDDGDESASGWTPIPDDTVHIENLKAGTYWIEARSDSLWETREEEGIPCEELGLEPSEENDDFCGKPFVMPGEEHVFRSEAIPLEMGETRYIKQVLSIGGTLYGRILLPPHLVGKKIQGEISSVSYHMGKNNEKVKSKITNNFIIDEKGEFNIQQLPEGEFSIELTSEDGYVSYYSGMKVDFDTVQSMDFDMSHARKEADDGTPLARPHDPSRDENFKKLSDEEQSKIMMEYIKGLHKRDDILKEQSEADMDE